MELGGFREELALRVPPSQRSTILALYDRLARRRDERAEFVARFQYWLKSLGVYRGDEDGTWGPYTESAVLALRPDMAGRCTRFDDLFSFVTSAEAEQEFPRLPALDPLVVVAAAIDRDLWLAGQCTGVGREARALLKSAGMDQGPTSPWFWLGLSVVGIAALVSVSIWVMGWRRRV